ncbi:uncharacterized protein TNCV_771741 [Trichonephila clavipes]|nr:uncharacterized protein TNCV_771741 [Trichonephila clavipes]
MVLYRSPLTVTLWPSWFLKKNGPMISPAHKVHQTSGIFARHPLFGLPLTQNHRRLHRQWCDERRMYAAEWKEVVFTESHVSICNNTMVGFESGDTVERGC